MYFDKNLLITLMIKSFYFFLDLTKKSKLIRNEN